MFPRNTSKHFVNGVLYHCYIYLTVELSLESNFPMSKDTKSPKNKTRKASQHCFAPFAPSISISIYSCKGV